MLPLLINLAVLARSGSVFANSRISGALEQIGLVSYSLYLWQGIATWDFDKYSSVEFYWASFLALPFAWISLRYIEKPFISAGHRWSTLIKGTLRPSLEEKIGDV
jgi:peptidoglycan/LPS O-acetylase OafA/YrhL